MMQATLRLRRAELLDGSIADILIRDGVITEIADWVDGGAAPVIDAAGGLLLPGLHDHHAHIAATAAARASVQCGPPAVRNAFDLAAALGAEGPGWLRGYGYHENITGGLIDRHWIDRVSSHRPIRVQHRSGRLWVFNTMGLELLLNAGHALPTGLQREAGVWTGRLFDEDLWLRRALGSAPPCFAAVGAELARSGVTGLTDMNPDNDSAAAAHFAAEHDRGALPQRVILAGRPELDCGRHPAITLGPLKLHLHEAHLPAFDEIVSALQAAHRKQRAAAVHCVTETELVFTLAAFRESGTLPGDRIEHASVTSEAMLSEIAALGLAVVTQPHFVAERGDDYRADVPAETHGDLYRLRSFLAAGIPLAGGTDTPFGAADPWAAMASAVFRRTPSGGMLGACEALTPEAALNLFLADPAALGRTRRIALGAPADLCLLSLPWRQVRTDLSARLVRATIIGGRLVHDRIDQPPAMGRSGADPLA